MGLPIAVAFFGSVRASELRLTADPRWAQYAPFANTRTSISLKPVNHRASSDSHRIPVRVASVVTDESSIAEFERHSTIETSMTGSVTGRSSIEIPVRVQSSERSDSELAESRLQHEQSAKKARGTNDETVAVIAKSADRIESQVKHVRESLDQIAKRQNEHQSDDRQQQTQILERQNKLLQHDAELRDAMRKLSEMANGPSAKIAIETQVMNKSLFTEPANTKTPATTHGLKTSQIDELHLHENPVNVPPEKRLSNSNHDDAESIQIRRDTGRDMVDIFTMDVHDADIRQFLTRLSEVAGVGILASPGVQGRISLHLRNVRLESAIKAIAKSRDYVFQRESGILVIRTAEEATRIKL